MKKYPLAESRQLSMSLCGVDFILSRFKDIAEKEMIWHLKWYASCIIIEL